MDTMSANVTMTITGEEVILGALTRVRHLSNQGRVAFP
jgi:hypothetical protein